MRNPMHSVHFTAACVSSYDVPEFRMLSSSLAEALRIGVQRAVGLQETEL
jgi:hypothetical protein